MNLMDHLKTELQKSFQLFYRNAQFFSFQWNSIFNYEPHLLRTELLLMPRERTKVLFQNKIMTETFVFQFPFETC